MLVMAAAGALAHLVSHLGQMVPMIGASAAISGAMAASMRFVFQRGGPLGLLRPGDADAYRVPAAPLLATLRDPRFLIFLAVWIGLNVLFGLGTVSIGGEEGRTSPGRRISAAFSPACCCSPRSILLHRTPNSTPNRAAERFDRCLPTLHAR